MKSIFVSKTIWFNAVSLILAVLALPEFISLLPVVVFPYIALTTSVGNVILRFLTDKPVTL